MACVVRVEMRVTKCASCCERVKRKEQCSNFAGGSCEELEPRTAEAGGILGDRSFRAVGVRKYFVCQRHGCFCGAQISGEFIRYKPQRASAEYCRTEHIGNECHGWVISGGVNSECFGAGCVWPGFIRHAGVKRCFRDGD